MQAMFPCGDQSTIAIFASHTSFNLVLPNFLHRDSDTSILCASNLALCRHAKEVTEIKLRSAAEQTRTQQARMQLFSARAELTAKATERKESADQRLAIAEKLIRSASFSAQAFCHA